MKKDERIRREVLAVINDYTDIDSLKDKDTPLSALGLDSLDGAEIGFEIKKRLHIRSADVITMALDGRTTINDIIREIHKLKIRISDRRGKRQAYRQEKRSYRMARKCRP